LHIGTHCLCCLLVFSHCSSLRSPVSEVAGLWYSSFYAFFVPPFLFTLIASLVLHAPPLQTVALPSLDEHEIFYENSLNTYSLSILSFCDSSKSSCRIRGAFTV
jgi:hypothetical protein